MSTLDYSAVYARIENQAKTQKLSPREANTLRLLGEEMVGMTENLAYIEELDFFVKSDEKNFELHLTAKAKISPEQKKQFVSASSKKKNVMFKGLKGKLLSVFEDLLYTGNNQVNSNNNQAYTELDYFQGYSYGALGYHTVWTMRDYVKTAPQEQQKRDWDGLEKSILLNFADDIIIGATLDKVDIIVKKSFDGAFGS